VYRYKGVTVVGLTDFPSRMAQQASQLYGTNLYHLLNDMGGSSHYNVDFEDEVVRGALILYKGELTWPAPKPKAAPEPPTPVSPTPSSTQAQPIAQPQPQAIPTAKSSSAQTKRKSRDLVWLTLAGLALLGVGLGAPTSFLSHLTVFVLACFIGWQVIWNVTPSLHTPLMSVTNAISGIIIIGGILQVFGAVGLPTLILGAIAILIGTINISGGFLVTQRMLTMFQK
jgi:NAD(P) transhydrogenase subunit alpha